MHLYYVQIFIFDFYVLGKIALNLAVKYFTGISLIEKLVY